MTRRIYLLAIALLLVGCVPVRVPGGKACKNPFTVSGYRALVVEESADRPKLPSAQASIFTAPDIRDYVASQKGEIRFFDKDKNTSLDPDEFQEAMKLPRPELPYLFIGNGRKGFKGPLPPSTAEMLALLKKYGSAK